MTRDFAVKFIQFFGTWHGISVSILLWIFSHDMGVLRRPSQQVSFHLFDRWHGNYRLIDPIWWHKAAGLTGLTDAQDHTFWSLCRTHAWHRHWSGKCQEFLLALAVDASSTEDESDPWETEFDESLGSSHLWCQHNIGRLCRTGRCFPVGLVRFFGGQSTYSR